MKSIFEKLQGVVSNINLETFGDFVVSYSNFDGVLHIYVTTKASKPVNLKVSDSAYFTNSSGSSNLSQETTVSGGADVYIKSGGESFKLIANSRYDIIDWFSMTQKFHIVETAMEQIGYMPLRNLQLNYGDIKGDISELVGKPICNSIIRFDTERQSSSSVNLMTGDIQSFADMTHAWTQLNVSNHTYVNGNISYLSSCVDLTLLNVSGTNCTGLIESLGSCTKLTSLRFASLGITGSIENFVSAQRTAGRNTCSGISLQCGSNVTYNGSNLPMWASKTLSWDAQGNITLS